MWVFVSNVTWKSASETFFLSTRLCLMLRTSFPFPSECIDFYHFRIRRCSEVSACSRLQLRPLTCLILRLFPGAQRGWAGTQVPRGPLCCWGRLVFGGSSLNSLSWQVKFIANSSTLPWPPSWTSKFCKYSIFVLLMGCEGAEGKCRRSDLPWRTLESQRRGSAFGRLILSGVVFSSSVAGYS